MEAREIEAELQPVGADVFSLKSGFDPGVALIEPVAIADHTEAERVPIDVHGGVTLAGPALLGVIQEPGEIEIEALLVLGADLEIDDDVVRRAAFGHVHPDIRGVKLLLDAVRQALKQRLIEVLAG